MNKNLIALFLFLSGCATYDPKTGKYTEDTKPMFTGSHEGNPIIMGIAGVAGVIQLAKYTSKETKLRGIHGQCVLDLGALKDDSGKNSPCTNTFLEVKNLKNGHVMTVWADERGAFYFDAEKGQQLAIQAVDAKTQKKSETLIVASPHFVHVKVPTEQKN